MICGAAWLSSTVAMRSLSRLDTYIFLVTIYSTAILPLIKVY